ncbi:hypothetical protein [Pelodictyon phaeoclathratiforme]|uniref:hypothetical protein n=1 Tax=Pelodictyon phaeoclathratiforme TaxID=34090 RepID=UPI0003253E52|nr:hypothetical protein [Pelodictyon phaeoclathratiforme]
MNKKRNIKDNPQKKECTGNHRKDNSIGQAHGRKKVRLQERLVRIRARLEIIKSFGFHCQQSDAIIIPGKRLSLVDENAPV